MRVLLAVSGGEQVTRTPSYCEPKAFTPVYVTERIHRSQIYLLAREPCCRRDWPLTPGQEEEVKEGEPGCKGCAVDLGP